jgi:hypothetical protein
MIYNNEVDYNMRCGKMYISHMCLRQTSNNFFRFCLEDVKLLKIILAQVRRNTLINTVNGLTV